MNLKFDKPPQEVLAQFKHLTKALIDASSIIYYLCYIDAIDQHQYLKYYTALQSFAWYSPKIWAYGKSVHYAIEKP
jgi:hypothetical protein